MSPSMSPCLHVSMSPYLPVIHLRVLGVLGKIKDMEKKKLGFLGPTAAYRESSSVAYDDTHFRNEQVSSGYHGAIRHSARNVQTRDVTKCSLHGEEPCMQVTLKNRDSSTNILNLTINHFNTQYNLYRRCQIQKRIRRRW